jgi:hypothetical protein
MQKNNLLLLLLLSLCLTTQTSLAQGNTPTLAALTETWTQINPGGETVCSTGEPYSFFVHPGTSDNLLIYFDGGGMCATHCLPAAKTIYERFRPLHRQIDSVWAYRRYTPHIQKTPRIISLSEITK